MSNPLIPDFEMIKLAIAGKCPRCREGALFEKGFTLNVREECPHCHLQLGTHDCGDGPAVFLIFILGFLLVPLALLFEFKMHPPLWAHIVVWGTLSVAITLGSMRPLKAYIIALQYKHHPGDWENEE